MAGAYSLTVAAVAAGVVTGVEAEKGGCCPRGGDMTPTVTMGDEENLILTMARR